MPAQANNRIKRAKLRLSRANVDALLVTGRANIIYLSGFYIPPIALLITGRGKSLYLVNPMNNTLAQKMLEGVNVQVVSARGSMVGTLARFIRDERIKRLGFNGENLSVSDYKKLFRLIPKVKMKPSSSILGEMRKIKDPEEIRILRKAAKETVRIWRKTAKNIKVGMSEREIASMIDISVRGAGYESSFPTIAATGKNSAYPHAVPMGRHLKKDDHLLVDFGIMVNGYCSDLTRIWAGGRIMRKIAQLRKHVRKARDRAIKKIKPGLSVGKLTKEANKYFKDNNLDKYIYHGLGHGVGLDIHEPPFLQDDSKEILRRGMVVTVEPGLYIPGIGGVREEDMVLVTKGGCEVLTR